MAFDPSRAGARGRGPRCGIAILRALLQRLRAVNVDDAPDGGAALAKMRARRYGLVIASWDMAPMTGCDFLYEMRSDRGLNRTPVVVIGKSKSDNVIASKKAGANSYIVKPFDALALKVKIDAAFATKAAPLAERPQAAEAAPSVPPAEEAPAADRRKFDGVATVSLK